MDKKLSAYRKFWQRIRRLSGVSDDVMPEPQVSPHTGTASAPEPSPSITANTVVRLRAMLKDRDVLSVGALHIINLGGIHARLEKVGRWKRLQARIDAIVSSVIRTRLDAVDLFIAIDGPAYVVVFGRLRDKEAAVKCSLLAKEIESRLLGVSNDLRDARVGTAMARLTRNGVELTEGPVDDEGILRIFDQSVGMLAQERQDVELAADEHALAARSDAAWTEDDEASVRNPWIIEEVEHAQPKDHATDWYYEKDRLRVPELRASYLPMWHVKQHAVGTFHCIPALPLIGSQVLLGESVFEAAPPVLIGDINLQLLDIAAREIKTLRDRGGEALIGLPVHFETIASQRQRSRYLAACSKLDEAIRDHFLIELIDLPEGSPEARLCELVSWLRPWGRAICVRTNIDCRRFEPFAAAHVFAVGTALGRVDSAEADLMTRMNAFTDGASKAGLKTYAMELRTRSLTVAAMGAGFDFISGPIISSLINAPASAYRFNPLDLYD